jgi:nucleotide-binding universal stress UspA family protein
MKKILVPCDFSKPAQEAFKISLDIASLGKGEVHVLHVIDLPVIYETTFGVQPYIADQAMMKELTSLAHQNFKNMVADVENSKKEVNIHFNLEQGGITSSIYEFINDQNIDLVIMASQGAGGWKGLFVGSTTEKIVRLSPVPVLTVKQHFNISTIKNIMFPTNLKLDQEDLINKIKEVQQIFKAKLHILFINTPNNFRRDKEITKDLEQFSQHFNFNDYTINIRNDIYEEYGIINFAQEINSDLIVMSTHGRRGIAHLVIGSIAEEVMSNVNCPVWTYKYKKK